MNKAERKERLKNLRDKIKKFEMSLGPCGFRASRSIHFNFILVPDDLSFKYKEIEFGNLRLSRKDNSIYRVSSYTFLEHATNPFSNHFICFDLVKD